MTRADDEAAIRALVAAQFAALRWSDNDEADWPAFEAGFLADALLVPAARPARAQPVAAFVARMCRLRADASLRTVTEAGRELFERATGVIEAVEATKTAMRAIRGEPTGLLRLSCGVEFGLLAVNGWIGEYLRRHPAMRVEVDMTNRAMDVVHEGIDVAIRVGSLLSSSLSARRLGEIGYGLYASPAYLADRPAIGSPSDLAHADLIVFAPTVPAGGGWRGWRIARGGERAEVIAVPRRLVSNNLAARDAVGAGHGVSLLPRFQARPLVETGALTRVLPDWSSASVPVHAVFASGRYLAPKVRAFVDLAVERFDTH